MSLAHVCHCRHVKSNHRKRTYKGISKYFNMYYECQVDNCNCDNFKGSIKIACGMVNIQ